MQPQAVSPAGDELLQDIIPGILVSLFASRRPRGGGQPLQTHPGLENQQEPPHCNPSPDSSCSELDPKARAVAGRCSAVTQRVELFVINAPLFWQGESCLFFLPLSSSSPRSGHRVPTCTPAEQPQPHTAVFFSFQRIRPGVQGSRALQQPASTSGTSVASAAPRCSEE